MNYFFPIESFNWVDAVDILIVAAVIYNIYISVSKTRALPVFKGFAAILLLTALAGFFQLKTTSAILEKVVSLMFLMVIVIFPAEIRRGFYSIGHTRLFGGLFRVSKSVPIAAICETAFELAKTRTGALLIIERNDFLQAIIDTGVALNADYDKNLILTLFNKHTPLHDGACVLRGGKILSAGSIIPMVSHEPMGQRKYGTRHRAALGLSEQSDAVVLIISEEKGTISIAHKSKLESDIPAKKLQARLTELIAPGERK